MLDRSSIASYIGAMFLAEPHFHDDDAARVYFEKIRWPEGRVCPHCGVIGGDLDVTNTAWTAGVRVTL